MASTVSKTHPTLKSVTIENRKPKLSMFAKDNTRNTNMVDELRAPYLTHMHLAGLKLFVIVQSSPKTWHNDVVAQHKNKLERSRLMRIDTKLTFSNIIVKEKGRNQLT